MTDTAVLEQIPDEKRDPVMLAGLRDCRRIRATEDEIVKALQEDYRHVYTSLYRCQNSRFEKNLPSLVDDMKRHHTRDGRLKSPIEISPNTTDSGCICCA